MRVLSDFTIIAVVSSHEEYMSMSLTAVKQDKDLKLHIL